MGEIVIGHSIPCSSMEIRRVAPTAAAMPRPTPIAPPNSESTTASTRNCRRMSREQAPTASRIPISRVRSVTETSMMFMMPTPPTISDTLATEPSSNVITSVMTPSTLRISELLNTSKSSGSSIADAMPLAHERLDFVFHLLHLIGRMGHDVDGLHVVERHAVDALGDGGAGGQHDVVLILAEEIRPFRLENADHREGMLLMRIVAPTQSEF